MKDRLDSVLVGLCQAMGLAQSLYTFIRSLASSAKDAKTCLMHVGSTNRGETLHAPIGFANLHS